MTAKRLKETRTEKNESIRKLAEEINIAYPQIERYESGKNEPPKNT